ncbi:hypothetical protein [Candidatus Mycolicibacterium alkanivorans]|uniref:Uncharacterized protein n=1 Tax=Candidatus Mycolicibacterium alkanivorans TaxID=2954114 RepID=A0ABS9YV57_9MYCO|nr:hypothetical protein [Candidatus Mycolicibacterium alkanivorans]MCI4675131.1 hypothetical protein [Candidatus Mycolicibacterium alkanivorans]
MATEGPARHPEREVALQSPTSFTAVHVHSCSRLGLHANPPGFRLSFGDWLRRR